MRNWGGESDAVQGQGQEGRREGEVITVQADPDTVRMISEASAKLIAAGREEHLLTLAWQMAKDGTLDQVGGASRLCRLFDERKLEFT